MITGDDLRAICRSKATTIDRFVRPLNAAMDEFGISENVQRETAFLAQIAHESGGFRYARELASGEAYEGRADLGNTEPGDGVRFKGRGLLQITGRNNYNRVGDALGVNLIDDPSQLEYPTLACRSAAWWWADRGLNDLADRGDFLRITKRINGGTNGWADRLALFERAKAQLA